MTLSSTSSLYNIIRNRHEPVSERPALTQTWQRHWALHYPCTGDRASTTSDVHTVRDPGPAGVANVNITQPDVRSTMYKTLWQKLCWPETPPKSWYIIHVIITFRLILWTFSVRFIILQYIPSHKLSNFLTKWRIFSTVLCLSYTIFLQQEDKSPCAQSWNPTCITSYHGIHVIYEKIMCSTTRW